MCIEHWLNPKCLRSDRVHTSVKVGVGGNSSFGRGSKANANSEALKCKQKIIWHNCSTGNGSILALRFLCNHATYLCRKQKLRQWPQYIYITI